MVDVIVRLSVFMQTTPYADQIVCGFQEQAVVAEWFAGKNPSLNCLASPRLTPLSVPQGVRNSFKNMWFTEN